MSYWARAVMALVGVAAAQVGCASKLDFDQVSAGRHLGDASAADASPGATVTPDAAAAFDAAAPAPTPPSDAAVLGTNPPVESLGTSPPRESDGSSDAGLSDAAREPDRTTFSCNTVSPEPLFCDDFESLALIDHWTDVLVDPAEPVPGGSIEIDSSAALAGHDSLFVQVNEGVSYCDNCLGLWAGLALPELQGPTKLTAEFDLRVEQIDPTAGRRVVLFQLVWGTPEAGFTQHTLQLESRGGSFRTGLVEFDTEGQLPESVKPPLSTLFEHEFAPTRALSQWMHVTYTLDARNASGTSNVAKLTVDDIVLFDGSPQFPLRGARMRLEIGAPWVDMSSFTAQDLSKRWQFRYDNVLVRSEPR